MYTYFRQDGTYVQDAGVDYVTYNYNLVGGSFFDVYDIQGYNPEESVINTDFYRQGYSGDWVRDALKIKAGNATQVDILDQDKTMLEPGLCVRTVENIYTRSRYPYLQQGWSFTRYPFMDGCQQWSADRPDAFFSMSKWMRSKPTGGYILSGVWYVLWTSAKRQLVCGIIAINISMDFVLDGEADSVSDTPPAWQLYSGSQGSMISFDVFNTNFPITNYRSYYLDDQVPDTEQCTGDEYAIGASGFWLDQDIPNTDPREAGYKLMESKTRTYFLAENRDVSQTAYLVSYEEQPLEVSIDLAVSNDSFPLDRNSLEVYPNPTDGVLYFSTGTNWPTSVQVYSLEGRLLYQTEVAGQQAVELPSYLEDGMYLLKASGVNEVKTVKTLPEPLNYSISFSRISISRMKRSTDSGSVPLQKERTCRSWSININLPL